MKYFNQSFHNIDFSSFSKEIYEKNQKEVISDNKDKGIFTLSDRRKKYLEISKNISDEMKSKYDNLVIFGMGGSSLAAKTIYNYHINSNPLKDNKGQIYFIDNIHYHNFTNFLRKLDFNNTAFLIISKSGNTIEVLCQTLVILDFYKNELANNKAQNIYFLTEDQDNNISQIAAKYNRPIIQHDKDIGGRFSAFTPVALIPVLFCNFNVEQYLDGGEEILQRFLSQDCELFIKGVFYLEENMKNNLNIQVSMPYLTRLYQFNYWYNQLFSESLGKNNKGINLIKALGSVDQHSILQLFLDGPKDKFFTFFTNDFRGKGDKIFVPDYLKNNLSYFDSNHLGDVIYANQEATIESVRNKNHPVRIFNFNDFDCKSIGAIMMYFMIETIFFAKKLDINPFDQPAVEFGKDRAKEILRK